MRNHGRYCSNALTIEPAVTTGRLYHLPYGFPAMFDLPAAPACADRLRRRHGAPDGQVFGEVMTFPDIEETLRALDHLEGYNPDSLSHYLRISKPATILPRMETVVAWCYVYTANRLEEIERAGEFIPGGCWRTFVRNGVSQPVHAGEVPTINYPR
ncbi:MAG: gamma-glutamylcyclotransferase family protein [bacterium]